MTRRWILAGALAALLAVGWLLARSRPEPPPDAVEIMRDVLSEPSTASVRAACSMCHVFPEPDILPREYWITAVRGMFSIAARRGIDMGVSEDRALAWYLFHAPDELPPAEGRTDAGPGSIAWSREDWRPDGGERPAVTHVQMARLLDGTGLDVLVSDVATDRVYALRQYGPRAETTVIGDVADPGRLAVTDLDADGLTDVVVAALGQFRPTNDPTGSVVWLRRTGATTFERTVLLDGLGRVADVHAADVNDDGRTDLVVAVFGWMENGGLLWLERTAGAGAPAFERRVLDARPGFTDARVVDLDGDGRKDVVALIAQEFQQVMVYWGSAEGFRAEPLFQAPNPDWGFTGLEVTDFTGDGLPDLIVTNGDNLDLTSPKPYHGVALLENEGARRFAYRHLTAMYGAHRAVAVDPTGSGSPGLVVSAWLPPSVAARTPEPESLIWLERVGPTRLVRRVLAREPVDYMTMAAGDATGDGHADLALGLMDLGVVDTLQSRPGPPATSWVTLWRNGGRRPRGGAPPADTIDWRRADAPRATGR